MTVIEITEANFETEVVNSDKPVVADNFAVWCGPCRMMAPVFEELAAEFAGKAKFVKINVDDNEKIAVKYNIQSIPTTLLLVKGKVKAMQVGAVPKETLKAWLNKNL